jgi:sulfate adenylyltransferase subunit 1 (EFTu-like GTPase family)
LGVPNAVKVKPGFQGVKVVAGKVVAGNVVAGKVVVVTGGTEKEVMGLDINEGAAKEGAAKEGATLGIALENAGNAEGPKSTPNTKGKKRSAR